MSGRTRKRRSRPDQTPRSLHRRTLRKLYQTLGRYSSPKLRKQTRARVAGILGRELDAADAGRWCTVICSANTGIRQSAREAPNRQNNSEREGAPGQALGEEQAK